MPGSGTANAFYDFVGPSPVNLWSSSHEYSILRSVSPQFFSLLSFNSYCPCLASFPSSIRIPESIPPTVSLDNRGATTKTLNISFVLCYPSAHLTASIAYELVASICTKGKRSVIIYYYYSKFSTSLSQGLSPENKVRHRVHHCSYHD